MKRTNFIGDWIEISDTERVVGKSKGILVQQKTQQFQRAIFFSLLNPQPNGAAFAGVAYRKKSFDFNSFTGLKLTVRAQGENFLYKVVLRHHSQQSSLQPSYETFFEVNLKTELFQFSLVCQSTLPSILNSINFLVFSHGSLELDP